MGKLDTREARLDAAIKDLERLREEWEALGSPVLSRGSQLQPIPHPLCKMILEKEQLVERMSRTEVAKGGRPTGSNSAPDRVEGEPPRRGKLKAV